MIGGIGRIGNLLNPRRIWGGGDSSLFHKSLVDYWNFAGKSNFDKDRNTIKGIKGNILNAYNFSWSLGSGYGLFTENYLTYRKVENVFVTDDHSINIMNFVPANTWILFKYGTEHLNTTRVRVTGLTANNQIAYGYSATNDGARVLMPIPKDGIYDLPESVVNTTSYNVGFIVQNALTKNVTIEQIPQYEGAIVTDGIDDYLKLNKVGYKIGTVIIKAIPLTLNKINYVFDVERKRTYFSYILDTDNTIQLISSFNSKKVYGNYDVLRYNDNNIANIYTPMFISCRFNINEYISMALYDIAIYEDILTDEEIQKEINAMNPYKLVQDYTFDKSNSDVDRDRVYNKLNPDEHIQLNNFAFSSNSGYGLYKENYLNYRTYMHPADTRADLTCTDSIINITEIYSNKAKFIEKQNEASSDYNVKVTGLTDDIDLYYVTYKTDGGIEIKLANGINNLLAGENYTGFRTKNFTGKCDITIEQIPEYPNHLVFDGVDDTTAPIPNLNSKQGTIMLQYDHIKSPGNAFAPIDENGLSMYQNGFIISSNGSTGTLQARSDELSTYVDLKTSLEGNISAFAYDDLGINLYNNESIRETFYVNKHSKYIFAKDVSTNWYSKLALKRIKIFDRKLTKNQLDIEYNKLLNE